MKRIIVAVAAVLAVGAGTFAFARRKSDDAPTYRFVPVEQGNVESTVTATGSLSAVRTVQVGTQVSGQIAELDADFNDHVKKGQVIARLDPTLLQQAVQSARADLARARAQADQNEFLANQEKSLYANHTVTETEYRTAVYNAAAARASLTSAQAALDRALQNLKYATIYSPVNGVVIERDVDVGQTVAASFSAPQLYLIAADLSKMQILVSVDESDIGQVKNGQPVTFTVQAYPDRTFTGVVSQVRMQSTTVQNVVNYTVVVSVPNPDGALLPGMTATVTFQVARASGVLTVNNAALRFRPTPEMIAQIRSRYGAADSARRGPVGSGTGGGEAPGGADGGRERTGGAGGRPFGGGFGGGGFARGAQGAFGGGMHGADMATLFYVDSAGKLAVTRVHTGLTDGQVTEISGPKLKQGLQVIAGVLSGDTGTSQDATTNPFQAQQERRGFRRGGF